MISRATFSPETTTLSNTGILKPVGIIKALKNGTPVKSNLHDKTFLKFLILGGNVVNLGTGLFKSYFGNCIKCSKKCSWKDHKNTPYILEHYLSKEVITLEELKKKYDDSKSKIFNKTRILENIKNNIYTLNQECIETQEKITETINRLRQIALNKDILSSEEHIELLIQSEKLERKEGFMQRIEALELMKKQKKLMREAYQNKIPPLEEINKFLEKTYEKENQLKKNNLCIVF